MTKVYLSQRGIPFVESNVSESVEAKNELRGMGFNTTPVTVIGGEVIRGYNLPKIQAALRALGIAV